MPAASLTYAQARKVMHEVNFDKRRYFEQLTNRLPRRTEAEAVVELPCFHRGAFAVFGDSVAQELAGRIARLRGSKVTENASRACSSADVFYKEASSLVDLRLSQRTPLPCTLRWAWFTVGLHHLYRRESVVLDQDCRSYRHRVNKTDWDAFQTGYAQFTPTAVALSDAVYHAFPRCWQAFGERAKASTRWRRTHVTLTSMVPPDPLVLLAHPAKFDWTAFWDLGLAEIWLAAQRRLAKQTTAFDFVDLGSLVAANPGVRCDGMHFGKALFSADDGPQKPVVEWCHSKAAAYDFVIREWSLRQHCA